MILSICPNCGSRLQRRKTISKNGLVTKYLCKKCNELFENLGAINTENFKNIMNRNGDKCHKVRRQNEILLIEFSKLFGGKIHKTGENKDGN